MKRIVILGLAIALSSTGWTQENMQSKQQKDKRKSEMQQDDLNNNKKVKKDPTKKTKRKKTQNEAELRMDHYNSTKDNNSGTPAEQRQMDSTINNHR